MIRIVIVEDLPIVLEGLKVLINGIEDFQICGEYQNGKLFLNELSTINADIVLTDIDMPVMDGITTTIEAIKRQPDLKIVALSMHSDRKYYYDMVTAGAKGFVLKQSQLSELETAIREVHRGNLFFSPELLRGIILDIENLDTEKISVQERFDLSDRELEVLNLICQGLTNKELAERLLVSIRTIENNKSKLMQKSQTKNTASLIIWAIKNKIVQM